MDARARLIRRCLRVTGALLLLAAGVLVSGAAASTTGCVIDPHMCAGYVCSCDKCIDCNDTPSNCDAACVKLCGP
jgi:hypothetical protein